MKKSAVLILAVLFFAAAASAVSAGPTVDRILQNKVLIVGTSADMPPLTFKTKDQKIAGMDFDLARLIAKAVGAELKMVEMPFTELIPALEKGKIDLVISSMTITPKRNLQVSFAGPYFMTGQSFVITKENAVAITVPEDMNKSGFTVAVSAGTTSEQFMKNQFPKTTLVPVKSKKEAISLLLQDKVKAIVADYPFCRMAALRYRDRGLVSNPPITLEPIGIAVRADDPQFLNAVQNFLLLLQVSGEMNKMRQAWFEDPTWILSLPDEDRFL